MDTIGIEIRKDSWAAVRLAEGLRGPRVAECFALTGGAEERIKRLSDYIKDRGLKDPHISVCLPRGASLVKSVSVSAPGKGAVEGILRFELDKYLPVPAEEACCGFAVLGRTRKVYTALLAASPKKEVEGLKALFSEAGFKDISIHAWQAAALNALIGCARAGRGRSVVSLWIRKDELAVEAFSSTTPVFSRRLKTGGLRPGGWSAATESELCFSLASALKALGKAEECIVICDEMPGDGFFMSLQSRLGIPVYADGLEPLGVASNYAPAAGAALARSWSVEGIDASLTGRTRPDRHGRLNLAAGAAAALLFLSVGLSYTVRDYIEIKRLDSALAEAGAGKERAKRLADSLRETEGAVAVLRSLDGGAGPGPLEALSELAGLLPDDAWLTEVEFNEGAVAIEGYSRSASSLMLRMEGSTVLSDFEFTGPVTRQEGGRERFRIRFKVNKPVEVSGHGKDVRAIQAKAGD